MDDVTLQGLRSRLQHDMKHAEAVFMQDGQVAPFVALTTTDGRLLPVVPDFGSAERKAGSMTAIRLVATVVDAATAKHLPAIWLPDGYPTSSGTPSESERRIRAVAVSSRAA